MGVQDMKKFLEIVGAGKSKIDPQRRGIKKIAIDTAWFVHNRFAVLWSQGCVAAESDPDAFYDKVDREIVNSAFGTMMTCHNKGITTVIWCFDGDKDERKMATAARSEVRRKNMEKLNSYDRGSDEYNECLKRNPTMRPGMMSRLTKLFRDSGLSVCLDPECSEGERLCARLANTGVVDAIMTVDTDVIPMGVKYAITDYHAWEGYMIDDILTKFSDAKGFDVSLKMFRDMCILLGCDYNSRIPLFGPAKIFKAFTENCNRLKKVLTAIKKSDETLEIETCKFHFDASQPVDPTYIHDIDLDLVEMVALKYKNAVIYHNTVAGKMILKAPFIDDYFNEDEQSEDQVRLCNMKSYLL